MKEYINKYRVSFNDALNSEPVKPSLTLNNDILLEPNEVMALMGAPGVGKSQLFEGLVYSFYNKRYGKPINTKKSFGFIFSDEVVKGRILHMDTERTLSDINNAVKRLVKRIEGLEGLEEVYTLNNRIQSTPKANAQELEEELKQAKQQDDPYSVVFLDGIIDFNITNKDLIMDFSAGHDAMSHVTRLANEYNCIIICTIHPNPGSERASGHIGSSLNKWSRAMIMLREKRGFDQVFEITAKFPQGKQSHGKILEDVYYMWDDSLGYNTAVPFVDIEGRKNQSGRKTKVAPFEYYSTKESCSELINKAIEEGQEVTKAEFKTIISLKVQEQAKDEVNSGRDAINEFIEYLVQNKYINVKKEGKSKLYSRIKVAKKREFIQTSIC